MHRALRWWSCCCCLVLLLIALAAPAQAAPVATVALALTTSGPGTVTVTPTGAGAADAPRYVPGTVVLLTAIPQPTLYYAEMPSGTVVCGQADRYAPRVVVNDAGRSDDLVSVDARGGPGA